MTQRETFTFIAVALLVWVLFAASLAVNPARAQDPPPATFTRPACADLAAYVAHLATLRERLPLGGGTRKEMNAAHAVLAACIDAHGLHHTNR